MKLSAESLAEFKRISTEKGTIYENDYECEAAANRLVSFVELMVDLQHQEDKRKKRLTSEPMGFAMPCEGRTCPLCGYSWGDEMWYDKWGMKCLDCQKALDKKVIPGYVFKDRDNNRHVTASMLSWKYSIHHSTIKKLVHQGQLKPRVVESSRGDILVFLKKENEQLPEVIKPYLKTSAK